MLSTDAGRITIGMALERLETARVAKDELYNAVKRGDSPDPVLVEMIRAAACTVREACLDTAPGLGETSPFAAALATVATACKKIEASDRPAFWLGMVDRALTLAIGALRTTEGDRS